MTEKHRGGGAMLFLGDGCLTLRTPWGEGPGAILVNGEPVGGPWETRGAGAYAIRHGEWILTVAEAPPGTVTLTIRNTGDEDAYLDRVVFGRWEPGVFGNELTCASFRELVHGGSFQQPACGVKPVGGQTLQLKHICNSSMFTVYQDNDGSGLLLGALPPQGGSFTTVTTLHSHRHLDGHFGFEISHEFRCKVEPGGEVRAWPITALGGDGGPELMSEYGDRWFAGLGSPDLKAPVVGWNSWDYYSGAVDGAAMDENMGQASLLFPDAVVVFCIDEGWEEQWGRWQPNAKFDHDLSGFCRSATDRGLCPGIWTSPMLVNTYTPLYLEHPEWFARDESGDIRGDLYAYGPMAYLDPTIPEVLDWLRTLYGDLRRQGFEYFKVDFVHCILKAHRFRDPRVPLNELIRRVFAVIREAVGPEAYVLSCGSPYESVVGLVDSVRTTGDIHVYWSHVLRNAHNLCTRWWMSRRLWNCDPDFLVVRGPETAKPPFGKVSPVKPLDVEQGWLAGREFNAAEARVWALLAYLNGDDIVLSDRLRDLEPAGIDIITSILPPRGRRALPVDLFTTEQSLPRIWISREDDDIVLGIFNWQDVPAATRVNLADLGIGGVGTDIFSGASLGAVESIEETMQRRSCRGLRISLPTPTALRTVGNQEIGAE